MVIFIILYMIYGSIRNSYTFHLIKKEVNYKEIEFSILKNTRLKKN
jgi:hypothetical protein